MIAVLDVSAAVELILARQRSNELSKLLSEAALVVSPDLYSAELTNVFWKLKKFGELSLTECERGLNEGLEFVDDLIPMHELAQEVLAAAVEYNTTAYDMYYAITARRYNAVLLTMDQKLKKTALELRIKCF